MKKIERTGLLKQQIPIISCRLDTQKLIEGNWINYPLSQRKEQLKFPTKKEKKQMPRALHRDRLLLSGQFWRGQEGKGDPKKGLQIQKDNRGKQDLRAQSKKNSI